MTEPFISPRSRPHENADSQGTLGPQALAVERWVCGLDNEDHETFAMGREFAAELMKALTKAQAEADASTALLREVLEAVCRRDGLSLDSEVEPGTPARNYELALRLGIAQVFGIPNEEDPDGR